MPNFNTEFMMDAFAFTTFEAGIVMCLPGILNVLNQNCKEKVEQILLQSVFAVANEGAGEASRLFAELCGADNVCQLSKVY